MTFKKIPNIAFFVLFIVLIGKKEPSMWLNRSEIIINATFQLLDII